VAQRFPMQVGVYESKTPKTSTSGPKPSEIGQHQAIGVTHDDVVDLPGAMNESAYLPGGFVRSFA